MLRHLTLWSAFLLIATPAIAQDWPLTTPEQNGASIIRSSRRAVTRLVAEESSRPPVVVTVSKANADLSDWSAVRNVNRGDKIILTRKGGEPAVRYLLSVDDVMIRTINLTDPDIPSPAAEAVLDTVDSHPDYFEALQTGRTFQLNKTVRLTPEGLWMGDRNVADLQRLLESVPRSDVAEISLFNKHLRPHVLRGMVIGALVGGMIVVMTTPPDSEYGGGGGFVAGAIFGAGFGAGIGAAVGGVAPQTPDVIYRSARSDAGRVRVSAGTASASSS